MKASVYGIDLFICKNPINDLFKFLILQNEFWKDIPGYENLYKVSSLGRVYSYKRIDKQGRSVGGLFKSRPIGRNKNYNIVTINKNGKKTSRDLHRLIMEVFLPGLKNQCVNHKNGIKNHNYLSNLEWCTYSENAKHSYSHNKRPPVISTKKITWEISDKIKSLSNTKTRKELSDMFGLSVSSISEILLGITWNKKERLNHKTEYKNPKHHSKYRGVGLSKCKTKWRARIIHNGKEISLGCFFSEIEAAKAYNKKSLELFGEYAFLNKI